MNPLPTIAEINAMTLTQLVAAYNTLAEKPLKKFETRPAGAKRLLALVDGIKLRSMEDLDPGMDVKPSEINVVDDDLTNEDCVAPVQNSEEDDLTDVLPSVAEDELFHTGLSRPVAVVLHMHELIAKGFNNEQVWEEIVGAYGADIEDEL